MQPRDAATVMLVRDGEGDRPLEVFMLQRNLHSVFVAGAHLFPGGAVDEADRHSDLDAVCTGRSDAEASAMLGIGSGGLAYWVAAIRECFEEAGVLLATGADGAVLGFDDPEVDARFATHRADIDAGRRRLVEVCAEESLQLDVGAIHYFSHWITPVGAPRRYDTRFFVARAPVGQVPLHDDHEAIAHLWVQPSNALERNRAGELDMILPTIRSLEAISRFTTADELLAAAAAISDVPTMLPRLVDEGGGLRITLPGDPGYEVPAASVQSTWSGGG